MATWDGPGHWTYTGNPADSTADRVRWLCGDVFEDDPLVNDESIAAAISVEGDAINAAASVCEHLSARFAREATKSVSAGGGLNTSVTYDQRSKAFAARAELLRERAAISSTMVYAGGLRRSDKVAAASDTDLLQPYFHRELFDAC